MKTVLYILSSRFENNIKFKNLCFRSDYIVAVDGGLLIAKDFDLVEKVIFTVGDFDTCKNPENIISKDKILRFSVKKDLTDSILAYNLFNENIKTNENINKNQKENFKHIFFSISGPRQDHFLSLIFYFTQFLNQKKLYLKNLKIKNLNQNKIIQENCFKNNKNDFLIDLLNIEFHNDVESIFLLNAAKYKIYEQKDKIFSFFPLTKVESLTISPVEYPFPIKLERFNSIGISNIFKDNIVDLRFREGNAILFIENKDGNPVKIERFR